MRLEDYLHQRLVVEKAGSLTLVRLPDDRYQVSVQRGRANAFTVEIHPNPVDAIWNAVCPLDLRRHPPTTSLDDLL